MQDAGYEQRQVLVEVRAQQLELRFAQGLAGAQPPCEQRQPSITGGEHVGEQIDQGQPALIVEFEHALHGTTKIILALVGKRTARSLPVELLGVRLHGKAATARRDRQLRSEPCVEGVDGFDAQPRRFKRKVDLEPLQMRSGAARELPGLFAKIRRRRIVRRALQGKQDALAHLLRPHGA